MPPDGRHLYVFGANSCYNSCARSGVSVLRRDPASGRLEMVEAAEETVGQTLSVVAMSPGGRHLYLVDRDFGFRVSGFAISSDGLLEAAGELQAQHSSAFSFVDAMTFAPDGDLYVSGFENRPVPRLERDPGDGALRLAERDGEVEDGMVGPLQLELAPGDRDLYVLAYPGEGIGHFRWDAEAGVMRHQRTLFRSEPGLEELEYPVVLKMSPDGRRLYALGEFSHLATFARGPEGELEVLGTFGEVAWGLPLDLVPSPDGEQLYVLDHYGVIQLDRDPATDALEHVATIRDAFSYQAFELSPDGRNAYALRLVECTEPSGCAELVELTRDQATGRLSERDVLSGFGSVAFDAPQSLAFSPGAEHLYLGRAPRWRPVDRRTGPRRVGRLARTGRARTDDWTRSRRL